MTPTVVLPAITSLLAVVFALALLDQWRDRRRGYQLVWAIGMTWYAIASGCEAIAGASGWNETLYKTWYTIGIATPAWLGLGTAFLVSRTRFGYTYGLLLALSGILAFVARGRYADAGNLPAIILFAGVGFGLAIAIETYFQNERWPSIAAIPIVVGTIGVALINWSAALPAPGYALDPRTNAPIADILPSSARLLALPLNLPGAGALILGAVFSTYMFMPKRRVLAYSLEPDQPGDQFLFNLVISAVAIPVNLVASLPGAVRAIAAGRVHSRVPATLLIALGAFVPSITDSLNRLGDTTFFQVGKLLGVVFLFVGFLVSIEVFREFRIPFTSIGLGGARHERTADGDANELPPPRPGARAPQAHEDARG